MWIQKSDFIQKAAVVQVINFVNSTCLSLCIVMNY